MIDRYNDIENKPTITQDRTTKVGRIRRGGVAGTNEQHTGKKITTLDSYNKIALCNRIPPREVVQYIKRKCVTSKHDCYARA